MMRSRNARASAAPLRGGWRSALEQEGRGGEAAAPPAANLAVTMTVHAAVQREWLFV